MSDNFWFKKKGHLRKASSQVHYLFLETHDSYINQAEIPFLGFCLQHWQILNIEGTAGDNSEWLKIQAIRL